MGRTNEAGREYFSAWNTIQCGKLLSRPVVCAADQPVSPAEAA